MGGCCVTEEQVLLIGTEALKTIIFLAGPLLLAAMSVGLVVSFLQAITQINESTLTFIPKMIAVIAVLFFMAPWMLDTMEQYTIQVITQAGESVH